MSTRVHYSPEIKWKAIAMKLNGDGNCIFTSNYHFL